MLQLWIALVCVTAVVGDDRVHAMAPAGPIVLASTAPVSIPYTLTSSQSAF